MTDPKFKVKEIESKDNYSEFVLEPLETGLGHTLGHAIRRVLLSSIPGAAITSVKISGVRHKFSEISGLKENVVDLLLNIKGLNIRLSETKETATLKLSVKGKHVITGKDIQVADGVEIANKDHYLGSLGDKGKLDMDMTVSRGYGYSLAEERQEESLGVMATDVVFSPVTRVNYAVESTRVGRKTNMDRLILQIWTNGSLSPKEALDETSKLLAAYFMHIYSPNASASAVEPAITSGPSISEDVLRMTVDELDLPTRIYNSLRNGGIETLEQLLHTPRKELIAMRNMGAKSISIIDEKLKEKGIALSI